MIPRPTYYLPAQTPIFERGGTGGLPGSGAVVSTQWFDTYQVQDGGIQNPQTLAIVSSGSEVITGVGTTYTIGAYYLDIYADHNNAAGAPMTIDIQGNIAQALEVAGPPTLLLRRLVAQAAELGSGEIRPLMTTVRIAVRFFRVVYTYPVGGGATRFSVALNLRAA